MRAVGRQWVGSGLNAHGGKRRANRQQVFSRALKTRRVASSLLKASVWSTTNDKKASVW